MIKITIKKINWGVWQIARKKMAIIIFLSPFIHAPL